MSRLSKKDKYKPNITTLLNKGSYEDIKEVLLEWLNVKQLIQQGHLPRHIGSSLKYQSHAGLMQSSLKEQKKRLGWKKSQ